MERRDPLWQAVFDELSFESDQELLDALRAHEIDEAVVGAVEDALRRERAGVPPADSNQEAVVGAVGDAQTRLYAGVPPANPNRAVNQATTTMIDLPPGCFNFPAGANIVAVEVVSIVLLSKFTCDVRVCPKFPLWPEALGTRTLRQLPAGWSGAVLSANSW